MMTSPSVWKRMDSSGLPLLLARLILGAMFLWMGFAKIGDPVDFLKQVRMYKMLPESAPIFLNGTAIVLPWLEVLSGVALILGVFLRGAAAILVAMLAVFTTAIFLRALAVHNAQGTPFFKIAFDCGCGAGVVIIWQKLLANVTLLATALIPLLSRSRRFCLSNRDCARSAERRESPVPPSPGTSRATIRR